LKNVAFDEILSSDLKRAKQSLNEITAFHKNTNVKFEESLRERNFGILEGEPVCVLKEIVEVISTCELEKEFKFQKIQTS
jgi:broad specificity phosphatase PhoE